MADACKIKIGNLVFELDASNERDLFEKVAHLNEVFNNVVCGKCRSENTFMRVRNVNDDKFYEYVCSDCYARFSLGCHKKGNTLFPHRKDKEGNYLPDGGWMKYNKETGKEE